MDKHLIAPHLRPLQPLPTGVKPQGELLRPVHCLLCDIYGTLIISASGDIGSVKPVGEHNTTIEALLLKYGLPFTPSRIKRELKQVIGARHEQSKKKGVEFPEIEIDRIWQSILGWSDRDKVREFAIEYEMITNPVWPMPGLRRLLTHCSHHGIRLGIVSNAQFYTPLILEWILDSDLVLLGFDPRLTIFSYRQRAAKPSSELFQLAAERLALMGIEKHHTAVVGNDIRNDIAPSQKVGFSTILFAGDRRSLRWRKDDPSSSWIIPDLVIDDLACLVHHL